MNTEMTYLLAALALLAIAAVITATLRNTFIVPEGHAGLLYHNGKFVEVLSPGRHVRWGRNLEVNEQDLRKATLTVPGQEILTADNVSLKFSLALAYQLIDPAKAVHETQSWTLDLYESAQLALRNVIGNIAVEALLT